MTLRPVIFWSHLAIGVTAALVVFMMSVTGVILTFEAQLNRWALRDYRTEAPTPGTVPLDLDDVVTRVPGGRPAVTVTSLAIRSDPRQPAVLEIEGGDSAYVDRFTGHVVGDGDTRTRRFLQSVIYWHRWFALEGDFRIIGRTFTATANLGFFFLVVSGVYLWWPRTRTRIAWTQAVWFRRGLAGRARDFNWHSVIGLWSAVPVAVIVASGATISYQWAGNLVYRVVGEAPPSGSPTADEVVRDDREAETLSGRDTSSGTLQALAERVASDIPGWRTMMLRLPVTDGAPVTVTVDRGTGRQPSKMEDFLFDRATGALVGRGGYPTYSRGLRLRRWLRFAHTGEVYGVPGQLVAGLVSLGAAVLVWTGLTMSWRRFFRSGGGS